MTPDQASRLFLPFRHLEEFTSNHTLMTPVRVIRIDRNSVRVIDDGAVESTHALNEQLAELGLCVGDVLWIDEGGVRSLGARFSVLRRSSRAHPYGQVLASNFDDVLLVVDAPSATRPALLERLATIGWDTGATPLFVITKTDLVDQDRLSDIESHLARSAPGIDSVLVSTRQPGGTERLRTRLGPCSMAVMLGHSGVGKSSLINTLSPSSGQATAAVRERDGKGKHTTTSRQLIDVGMHGFIIDTPGVRELGVQSPEAVKQTFDDVAALADTCRFSDCQHVGEPGCAVRLAVDAGSVTQGRYVGYMKLIREAEFAASKGTPNVRNKDAEWNRLSRAYRKARGW